MTGEETAGYITHHLKLAGRTDTLFSEDAMALVHDAARGLPWATTQALHAAMTDRLGLRELERPHGGVFVLGVRDGRVHLSSDLIMLPDPGEHL